MYDDMSSQKKIKKSHRRTNKPNIFRVVSASLIILFLLFALYGLFLILSDETLSSQDNKVSDINKPEITIDQKIIENTFFDTLGSSLSPEAEDTLQRSLIEDEIINGDTSENADTIFINSGSQIIESQNTFSIENTSGISGGPTETLPQIDGTSSGEENSKISKVVVFNEYFVESDDTIQSIAKKFGIKPETIVGVNHITSVDDIKSGLKLLIPDRDGLMYIVKSGDSLTEIAVSNGLGYMGYIPLAEVNGLNSEVIRTNDKLFIPGKTISNEDYQKIMKTFFIPPAQGEIINKFGDKIIPINQNEEKELDGIYIKNDSGTSVVASMTGSVIKVEDNKISEFGLSIILEHENGYITSYRHLDSILVKQGDKVVQGQKIGTLGSTGNIVEPRLFFKITKNNEAINPEIFF